MKKTILFLFIFYSYSGMAQITGTVGVNNGANGPYEYPCPLQDFYTASRAQYLYTAAELNAIGLTQGSFITEIGWIVAAQVIQNYQLEWHTISLANTNISSL